MRRYILEKQEQINEAIERLEILVDKGLLPTVKNEFAKSHTLYYSESQPLGGILYYVDNEEELSTLTKRFEEEHDAVVYHAMLTRTYFGTIFDLFYVSQWPDEWDDDKEKLRLGTACNYAANLSFKDLSEFGWEYFKIKNGGLVRTG